MALQSKLGLTDEVALARAEEKLSKQKALALYDTGLLDTFPVGTFAGLAKIHAYLFGEIYDFAGQLRTVNIAKGNFRFAPLMYLEAALGNIDKMPQSLHPESRWNRDEFNAVLSGPVDQQDEKFYEFIVKFYEEYQGTDDQKINEFYDHLFQNERQVSEVNWISLWESVRTSYENWLESEKLEDDWIRAERAANAASKS